jgi:hypothetical protein
VATPTSERGWWPTRRSRREPPAEKVRLPDSFELEVTVDVKNLCLFWRRRDDDALGIFGSRAEVGRPVTVAHAWAAVALLKEIGEAGALRLAKRIEVQCFEEPMNVTWHHDELPAGVRQRDVAKPRCSYFIEPLTKLKCSYRGDYSVDGARGSFCELHARRTAVRVAQRPNPDVIRRRERKKKNAGTPTSST